MTGDPEGSPLDFIGREIYERWCNDPRESATAGLRAAVSRFLVSLTSEPNQRRWAPVERVGRLHAVASERHGYVHVIYWFDEAANVVGLISLTTKRPEDPWDYVPLGLQEYR